jgi:hypothetical protein
MSKNAYTSAWTWANSSIPGERLSLTQAKRTMPKKEHGGIKPKLVEGKIRFESSAEQRELRAGDLCPVCQQERLEYDGLLNLSCPHCGAAASGCFT